MPVMDLGRLCGSVHPGQGASRIRGKHRQPLRPRRDPLTRQIQNLAGHPTKHHRQPVSHPQPDRSESRTGTNVPWRWSPPPGEGRSSPSTVITSSTGSRVGRPNTMTQNPNQVPRSRASWFALGRTAMIAAHRLNQPVPIGLTQFGARPVTAPAPSSSGCSSPAPPSVNKPQSGPQLRRHEPLILLIMRVLAADGDAALPAPILVISQTAIPDPDAPTTALPTAAAPPAPTPAPQSP